LVNSSESEFSYIDPLQSILLKKKVKKSQIVEACSNIGEELDNYYRAALEVTRVGELCFQVPTDVNNLLVSLYDFIKISI